MPSQAHQKLTEKERSNKQHKCLYERKDRFTKAMYPPPFSSISLFLSRASDRIMNFYRALHRKAEELSVVAWPVSALILT